MPVVSHVIRCCLTDVQSVKSEVTLDDADVVSLSSQDVNFILDCQTQSTGDFTALFDILYNSEPSDLVS